MYIKYLPTYAHNFRLFRHFWVSKFVNFSWAQRLNFHESIFNVNWWDAYWVRYSSYKVSGGSSNCSNKSTHSDNCWAVDYNSIMVSLFFVKLRTESAFWWQWASYCSTVWFFLFTIHIPHNLTKILPLHYRLTVKDKTRTHRRELFLA